eukprot:1138884-Pelagomonas_calceolata.AAC.3
MYEQALYKLGGLVVQGLAALDQSLEAAKLLPKLEATPEAPDVIDPDTGEVKSEFSRACLCLPPAHSPFDSYLGWANIE